MTTTALEERIAHLEAALDDVSAEMARMREENAALQRRVEALAALLREAREGDDAPAPDRPPPHW